MGVFETKQKLEEWLVYGSYPRVVLAESKAEKREVVEEIVNSYLLKDVFSLERVRAPKVLVNLLRLLAFQVGSQVSLSELASQ